MRQGDLAPHRGDFGGERFAVAGEPVAQDAPLPGGGPGGRDPLAGLGEEPADLHGAERAADEVMGPGGDDDPGSVSADVAAVAGPFQDDPGDPGGVPPAAGTGQAEHVEEKPGVARMAGAASDVERRFPGGDVRVSGPDPV